MIVVISHGRNQCNSTSGRPWIRRSIGRHLETGCMIRCGVFTGIRKPATTEPLLYELFIGVALCCPYFGKFPFQRGDIGDSERDETQKHDQVAECYHQMYNPVSSFLQ